MFILLVLVDIVSVGIFIVTVFCFLVFCWDYCTGTGGKFIYKYIYI